MKKIAFDESGYTGQDLTNKEQPVFTLSSVNFTEEEASMLLNLITTNAEEIKFNKLRKYSKFEKELETLLNHDIISNKTVRIAIAHKEYMIIAQTVDKLIEPIAYQDGLDIYEEGMNLALTNMLYYCIPALCDSELVDKYYIAFVNMFRKKEKNEIDIFYQVTRELINSSKTDEFKSTLELILHSHDMIDEILAEADNFYLDVSATSLTKLCDYWGKTLDEPFDVIADESKPLKHFEWFFTKIKSLNIANKEIGYGSRTMTLPLKINNLSFENSKQFNQIQVADLIAGASAYYGKSLTRYGQNDSLSQMIGKSKISELFLNPIWPHKAFTPEDLNMDKSGNNAIDELMKIINTEN